MKYYLILVLNLFFLSVYSQKLPEKLVDRPDGITITYFDFSNQSNQISNEIFLGKELKFKFPAYKNYTRIDISEKKTEIETIQKYLTANLIQTTQNCCYRKNCPDTIKGYYLMIKKGNDSKYIYLDYDFLATELCGSEELKKIIDSFNSI
ncbi:hypothetical protein [Flavobacterium phycosphaerae]|uniref:hypothetical protein n=1 Tax=Flavobacterium phycosphaerae TaxID=2697515 RepID=UPI00138A1FEF|nr:hypothetical protein [Flavobacterium phycosphaerae]